MADYGARCIYHVLKKHFSLEDIGEKIAEEMQLNIEEVKKKCIIFKYKKSFSNVDDIEKNMTAEMITSIRSLSKKHSDEIKSELGWFNTDCIHEHYIDECYNIKLCKSSRLVYLELDLTEER